MEHSLEHAIRERAYYHWLAAGRRDGDADRHWLTAEREVLETAAPTLRPKAPRKAPVRKAKAKARAA